MRGAGKSVSDTSGLTGPDEIYIILVLAALLLTAVLTRRLAHVARD
jgi:hypothetical protein